MPLSSSQPISSPLLSNTVTKASTSPIERKMYTPETVGVKYITLLSPSSSIVISVATPGSIEDVAADTGSTTKALKITQSASIILHIFLAKFFIKASPFLVLKLANNI